MTEQPPKAPSNALGVIALVFSIIGLILVLTLFGAPLGAVLLALALIFGLIGMCKKPRGKAVTGFILSLVWLFAVGYAVYWTASAILMPATEFATWITSETQNNTEMKLVLKQPGFDNFLSQRVEARFRAMDRSEFSVSGNLKNMVGNATALILNEVKMEIMLSVDAWIEQYGLPLPAGEVAIDLTESEAWEPITIEQVDLLLQEGAPEGATEGDDDVILRELEALLQELDA